MNLKVLWLAPLLLLLTACPGTTSKPSLLVPTGLTASPGDKQVTLSWQALEDKNVKSYLVLGETAGETAQTITVTAPATGTIVKGLKNDKTYSFKIAADYISSETSGYSAAVSATPKANSVASKVATPTGLSVLAGEAQVTLSWNANSEADLKGYTLYWGTQPTALSENKFINAGTITTDITGLSNNTTYFFAIEAENTVGEKSARSNIETATPTAVPRQPVIQSVVIDNNGSSLQVRQGVTFTMTLTGQRFTGVISASLGSLGTIIDNATDTEMRLEVTIPHGQALGFLDLSVTTSNGVATKNRVIEVTEISVAKSDRFSPADTNIGTRERPFFTLTKALSVANAGDTIFLGVGTYSQGETWPVEQGGFPPTIPSNVPAGVTIVGQVKDQVILEGPGQGQGGTSALVLASNATLRNLTVTQFTRALVHVYDPNQQGFDGDITLENLEVFENFDGFLSYGAFTITIKNSSFSINGDGGVAGSGVFIANYGDVAISDTSFDSNGYGLFATGGRGFYLTNVTSENNLVNGFQLSDHAQAILTNVKALNNKGSGIEVTSDDGSFTMRSSKLSGNDGTGMTITGAGYGAVDLGADGDGGNNDFSDNSDWQIYDLREANAPTAITAKQNIFGNTTVTPGTQTATDTVGGLSKVENGVKLWKIEQEGNTISF